MFPRWWRREPAFSQTDADKRVDDVVTQVEGRYGCGPQGNRSARVLADRIAAHRSVLRQPRRDRRRRPPRRHLGSRQIQPACNFPSSVKGKSHAHSPLVGRHSDSPDHPDHAAAVSTTREPPRPKAGDFRHAQGCLLRREQDSRDVAENGKGRAVERRSTHHERFRPLDIPGARASPHGPSHLWK